MNELLLKLKSINSLILTKYYLFTTLKIFNNYLLDTVNCVQSYINRICVVNNMLILGM